MNENIFIPQQYELKLIKATITNSHALKNDLEVKGFIIHLEIIIYISLYNIYQIFLANEAFQLQYNLVPGHINDRVTEHCQFLHISTDYTVCNKAVTF